MAEIPKPIDSTNVFLCGPVSSGKTWLMEQWIGGMARSVTIDATGAFISRSDFDHITGAPRELCDRLEQNEHYYRIAYHPLNMQQDFEWVTQAMWQLTLSRWLIVDEVQRVLGDSIQGAGELVCQLARHNLLGFIGAAQRIADVSKGFTSSCRMVILFQTSEVRDIIAVSERWGKEMANAVQNLQPCIYDDNTEEVRQTPECVVWVRGLGYKVFSLGDKKFTNTEALWDEVSAEAPKAQAQSSSHQDSGNSEQELPEHTSDPTSQS